MAEDNKTEFELADEEARRLQEHDRFMRYHYGE